MGRTFCVALLCVALAGAGGLARPVAAQENPQARPVPPQGFPGRGPGGEDPNGPPRVQPGELQRLFDAYFLANVQEALGLTDDQFAQVVPQLKRLQQVRREHQQRRRVELMELRRMSMTAGSDDASLRDHLKSLNDIEDRFVQDQRAALAGIDTVLNVHQQARLRVYEEDMERRKLDLIGRFQRSQSRRFMRPDGRRMEPPPRPQ